MCATCGEITLVIFQESGQMFHQLVSGKPIPLLEASVNTSLVALRLLFLPFFPSSFFFSSLHPRVSSVRATNQGDEHTCVNVTRTAAWMTRGEERETGERSECPFAEGEGQGKVDFWWLVKAGRIVSRCGGFTSGLAFSPFVFVRNTAVKRSSAASRNKWHGAPKTGPSPRRGPYLYEISS